MVMSLWLKSNIENARWLVAGMQDFQIDREMNIFIILLMPLSPWEVGGNLSVSPAPISLKVSKAEIQANSSQHKDTLLPHILETIVWKTSHPESKSASIAYGIHDGYSGVGLNTS